MEKEKSLFNIFGHLNPINRQEKEVSLAEESERDEDAVIQIENLNIYIRNNHILKNVNLTLHDKKITCIIGPSGCGKTTLLRSINRMIDTTEHLRVEGRGIGQRRRHLRPQSRNHSYTKKNRAAFTTPYSSTHVDIR